MGSLLKNRYCSTLFIAAVFIVTIPFTIAQDAMKPKLTESSEFEVIGIEARTNNAQESGGDGAIPKQWQRLFMENLLSRIPDRLDQSIVAVYSNYASDWNGNYTYILGAKVKPGTKAPEGMVAKSVPGGRYLEFTSSRGRPEKVVPDMWKEVWTRFQIPGNPARAYRADYEIYGDLSDPTNMQVKLYVGIKP
jgi:predicted transcriptional regulator YdeE